MGAEAVPLRTLALTARRLSSSSKRSQIVVNVIEHAAAPPSLNDTPSSAIHYLIARRTPQNQPAAFLQTVARILADDLRWQAAMVIDTGLPDASPYATGFGGRGMEIAGEGRDPTRLIRLSRLLVVYDRFLYVPWQWYEILWHLFRRNPAGQLSLRDMEMKCLAAFLGRETEEVELRGPEEMPALVPTPCLQLEDAELRYHPATQRVVLIECGRIRVLELSPELANLPGDVVVRTPSRGLTCYQIKSGAGELRIAIASPDASPKDIFTGLCQVNSPHDVFQAPWPNGAKIAAASGKARIRALRESFDLALRWLTTLVATVASFSIPERLEGLGLSCCAALQTMAQDRTPQRIELPVLNNPTNPGLLLRKHTRPPAGLELLTDDQVWIPLHRACMGTEPADRQPFNASPGRRLGEVWSCVPGLESLERRTWLTLPTTYRRWYYRKLPRNHRVFICYSRGEASPVARAVCEALRHRDCDPFLDTDSIPAGALWRPALAGAVLGCDVMVVVWDQAWETSPYCQLEWQLFQQRYGSAQVPEGAVFVATLAEDPPPPTSALANLLPQIRVTHLKDDDHIRLLSARIRDHLDRLRAATLPPSPGAT